VGAKNRGARHANRSSPVISRLDAQIGFENRQGLRTPVAVGIDPIEEHRSLAKFWQKKTPGAGT
jgi:hypothetical protein